MITRYVQSRLQPRTFLFRDKDYNCFYHDYNLTWSNERCVELPLGFDYIERFQNKRILEVGNILSHYKKISHKIIDKYEHAPDVLNEDIIEYKSSEQYNLVLSIATFEHIGFNDNLSNYESSGEKIIASIASCKAHLAPDN